ncbi:Variable major protein (plasmid) [Borrelia crocidurae DOU]|uniref:Variable major protein n=1 Tax=Borrelia crocidurae DOU TaxID=1293575 RepID=W5SQZ2_9SPIR|nr:Variable major protein [Borrelia crocidurae DOU]
MVLGIFSVFGSAIGDRLGFSVLKSGYKRDKIVEYFEKIKKDWKGLMKS